MSSSFQAKAHAQYLQRHADPAADLSDDGGGHSSGGVALVAVELDHWALRGEVFGMLLLIQPL